MGNRRIVAAIFVAAIALLMAGGSPQPSPPASTASPTGSGALRTLTVVNESWPPFRIDDPDSRWGFTGIDVDILERLEKALGVKIVFQRHPFARCLEMMRNGSADFITGVARNAEREAYLLYVPTSYFTVGPVFYAPKGKGGAVRSYADLAGKKIGFSLNSLYFEPFNSDASLEKVGISTELQLIHMLSLGRLDLIIGTLPNIAWDVRREGLAEKLEQTTYVPEQETPIYLAVSRKSKAIDLVDSMDSFLRGLLKSGEVDRIAGAYR